MQRNSRSEVMRLPVSRNIKTYSSPPYLSRFHVSITLSGSLCGVAGHVFEVKTRLCSHYETLSQPAIERGENIRNYSPALRTLIIKSSAALRTFRVSTARFRSLHRLQVLSEKLTYHSSSYGIDALEEKGNALGFTHPTRQVSEPVPPLQPSLFMTSCLLPYRLLSMAPSNATAVRIITPSPSKTMTSHTRETISIPSPLPGPKNSVRIIGSRTSWATRPRPKGAGSNNRS